MASSVGKKIELLASAARTATENSDVRSLPEGATEVGILMNTTAYTSGNFTAKLQTSSDGTNWTDVTAATTGATGQAYAFATANCLSQVRCVITGASTPVATQQVFVIFNSNN